MGNQNIEQIVNDLDNLWDKYCHYRGYFSTEQVIEMEEEITCLISDLRIATF